MKIDVESFLNFYSQLKKRTYWKEGNKTKIDNSSEAVEILQRRFNDRENLYLGIIGEFSAGKSTLINAILHQKNLLKEDIIQGTTCAPTFIRYGKAFDIIIDYIDGKQAKLKDSGLYKVYSKSDQSIDFQSGPVREFIDKYTATEEFSARVDKVTIYLNNPNLQEGLVIVDTPGINAENPRHSVVTKQTIKKYCDATMILTHANAPCSETLCTFIRENLHGVVGSCIGVVSKIDSLRRVSEQDIQVQFVKDRFKSEFGKPFSAVLPVSAIFSEGIESEDTPRVEPEMLPRYKQMFDDLESTIHQQLIEGRDAILRRSLRQSVLDIISQLQKQLELLQKDLKERQDKLEKNQLVNLQDWYEEMKQTYICKFNDVSATIDLQDVLDTAYDYLYDTLESDVDYCDSREELENVAKKHFPQHCKYAQKRVFKKIQSIKDKYVRWANNSCKDFQKRFKTEFRKLSADVQLPQNITVTLKNLRYDVDELELDLSGDALRKYMTDILGSTWGSSISDVFEIIRKLLPEWLGKYIDSYTIESVQNKVWDKISDALDDFRDALKNFINKAYGKIENQTWKSVFNYTDNIVAQFKPEITKIIQQEQNELECLQSYQSQLEKDLKQLHEYELSTTEF